MTKKLIVLTTFLFSIGCSSIKFIGNPITINSENLNIKLSEEDLVFFNE